MTRHRFSARARRAPGQPIGTLMAQALANPDVISLAAGFVDQESLPVELMQQATERILSNPHEGRRALQYGTTLGVPALRHYLSHAAAEKDGYPSGYPGTSLEQVIITPGSNQLLYLIADVLLDPGDIVLCAAPTYFVVLGTFASMGAEAVGVATDAEGIVPAALEDTLRRLEFEGRLPRVKGLYLVSYFDNPCGITMSQSRREQVFQIVQRWSKHGTIYLIDDAAYRDLRYDGSDVVSFRGLDGAADSVILASTFSKCFSPGLRLGWGVLPRELADVVKQQKDNLDFGTSNFSQQVLLSVLESGQLDAHVSQLCRVYSAKRDTIDRALQASLAPVDGIRWQRPSGGLYVWVDLPPSCDTGLDGPLFDLAVKRGMLYVPGEYFYPPSGVAVRRNQVRMSFGVPTAERLVEGVKAFAGAVASCLTDANR